MLLFCEANHVDMLLTPKTSKNDRTVADHIFRTLASCLCKKCVDFQKHRVKTGTNVVLKKKVLFCFLSRVYVSYRHPQLFEEKHKKKKAMTSTFFLKQTLFHPSLPKLEDFVLSHPEWVFRPELKIFATENLNIKKDEEWHAIQWTAFQILIELQFVMGSLLIEYFDYIQDYLVTKNMYLPWTTEEWRKTEKKPFDVKSSIRLPFFSYFLSVFNGDFTTIMHLRTSLKKPKYLSAAKTRLVNIEKILKETCGTILAFYYATILPFSAEYLDVFEEDKRSIGSNRNSLELGAGKRQDINTKFDAGAVILVDEKREYKGHVYVWVSAKTQQCEMLGIRTSIENFMLSKCGKGTRKVGEQLAKGVIEYCMTVANCKEGKNPCFPIHVDRPLGVMPLTLASLGFEPVTPYPSGEIPRFARREDYVDFILKNPSLSVRK
jgi:hypothetical protein